MNRAYSVLEIKKANEDARIIEGIATTPTPDRVGDVVEPMGANFKLPMPLLWQHDTTAPVGEVTFAKPTKNGIPFRARIAQSSEPGRLKDRLDEAWQSIKLNLVRAVSIGFTIADYEVMKDGAWRISDWEWLELSLVTIPANADATITTIKSIDTALLAASGQKLRSGERTLSPGVSGPRSGVKAKEARAMKKRTLAEQIAAFETTRKAKSERMTELMDTASEKDETLDEASREEYDTLKSEVADVSEHLTRLREQEELNKKSAIEPVIIPAEAGQARSGVRVSGMKSNLPQGMPFVRVMLALARTAGNKMEALEHAKGNKQWRDESPEVETVLKAVVAAGTTTASTWSAPLVEYNFMASEFIEYLRPRTIIGRIPGLRRVPFKIKVPRQTAVASVNWVGEGKPKPVGAGAFDSITLDHTKIAGIIVLTEELVRLSNPSAEALARDDLASGIIQLMDQDFVDPDKAAVANVSPASIISGVTPTVASGTNYAAFVTDVKATLNKFMAANISPESMVVLMRQENALALSLMVTSLGNPQFPGLTMDGGMLLGLPVITSQNIQYTEDSPQEGGPIIFLKANEIMLADDGQVNVDISREASIQMNSTPDDPATAATVMVSLFQHNMVGIRAERMINWAKRRAEAAQYISAAKYA